jgi:hypothetical protein
MQTLTVQITNTSALKALHALEEKRYIKIVKSPGIASLSLPGKELDLPVLEAWISDAENASTVSLKEAKSRWATKEKHLQKITK